VTIAHSPRVCAGAKKAGMETRIGVVRSGVMNSIDFDDTVGEVMDARPATIRVFLDFRMGCVGCPIAAFHTVEEACNEHGVNRDEFLAALRAIADTVMA
jgi:hybrid cluster-associated redox disulfide protein